MSSRAPVWGGVTKSTARSGCGAQALEDVADDLADGDGGDRVLGEGGGEGHLSPPDRPAGSPAGAA